MTEAKRVTGAEVRAVSFRDKKSGTYERKMIDELRESIADRIDAGLSPTDLITRHGSEKLPNSPGYDAKQVDRFLDMIAIQFWPGSFPTADELEQVQRVLDGADVESHSSSAARSSPWEVGVATATMAAWSDRSFMSHASFDKLPGMRLIFRHNSLLTSKGEVLATVKGYVGWRRIVYFFGFMDDVQTFALGGDERYSLRLVDQDRRSHRIQDPNVAAVQALTHRTALDSGRKRVGPDSKTKPVQVQQLTCELSGQPVLWTSGTNYDHEATGLIAFPGARSLQFPVYGIKARSAIMVAVDQSDVRRVLYQQAAPHFKEVSVIVNPADELSEELLLAITLSAPMLKGFFTSPSPDDTTSPTYIGS
jgi:hypothetical protein